MGPYALSLPSAISHRPCSTPFVPCRRWLHPPCSLVVGVKASGSSIGCQAVTAQHEMGQQQQQQQQQAIVEVNGVLAGSAIIEYCMQAV